LYCLLWWSCRLTDRAQILHKGVVKGQIKLQFKDSAGKTVTAVRSSEITMKAGGKTSMKTLDSTISRKAGDDESSRVDMSCRAKEMARLIPEYLGVPGPILENVVFCHQEDSTWPMQDGAALKTKFDEIFGTSKYTKAMDSVKAKKKEINSALIECRTSLSRKATLAEEARNLTTKKAALEQSVVDIRAKNSTALTRIDQCRGRLAALDGVVGRERKLQASLASTSSALKTAQDNFARLSKQLREDFRVNVDELETTSLSKSLDAAMSRADQVRGQREANSKAKSRAQRDLSDMSRKLQELHVSRTKFQHRIREYVSAAVDCQLEMEAVAKTLGVAFSFTGPLPARESDSVDDSSIAEQCKSLRACEDSWLGACREVLNAATRDMSAKGELLKKPGTSAATELVRLEGQLQESRSRESELRGVIAHRDVAIQSAQARIRAAEEELQELSARSLEQTRLLKEAKAQSVDVSSQIEESQHSASASSEIDRSRRCEQLSESILLLKRQLVAFRLQEAALREVAEQTLTVSVLTRVLGGLKPHAAAALAPWRARLEEIGVSVTDDLDDLSVPQQRVDTHRRSVQGQLASTTQRIKDNRSGQALVRDALSEVTAHTRVLREEQGRLQSLLERGDAAGVSLWDERSNCPASEAEFDERITEGRETLQLRLERSCKETVTTTAVEWVGAKSVSGHQCQLCGGHVGDSLPSSPSVLVRKILRGDAAMELSSADQCFLDLARVERLKEARAAWLRLNETEASLRLREADHRREHDRLVSEMTSLTAEEESLRARVQEAEAMLHAFDTAITILSAASAQAKELEAATRVLKRKVTSLPSSSSSSSLSSSLDEEEQGLVLKLQEMLAAAPREIETFSFRELATLMEQLEELLSSRQIQLDRLRSVQSDASQSIRELKAQLSRLHEQESRATDHFKRCASLEETVERLSAEVGTHEEERASLRKDLVRVAGEIAELEVFVRDARDAATKERSSAKLELEVLDRATRRATTLFERVSNLGRTDPLGRVELAEREIQGLMDKQAATMAEVEELDALDATLQLELSSADNARMEARLRVDAVEHRTEIARLQDTRNVLERDLAAVQEELASGTFASGSDEVEFVSDRDLIGEASRPAKRAREAPSEEVQIAERLELLRARMEQLVVFRSRNDGRLHELTKELQIVEDRLDSTTLRRVEDEVGSETIRETTLGVALEDLDLFNAGLERALARFHDLKIADVNTVIRRLWSITYRGRDIDSIELKSEVDSGSSRRSYNYRLVMFKNGVEMDMKGRCSAGQKMLASLVIRLALQQTFATASCGVLTLDEPTTNLDEENKLGLAHAIASLLQESIAQEHFQLVVITHDLRFVENLHMSMQEAGAATSLPEQVWVVQRRPHKSVVGKFVSSIEERAWDELMR
jgi:DNA repair protein RAD50